MSTESRKERVTLKTVAERAGVSVATVSLILSGRDEWLRQFHPDTVSKVQHCAKRLGYRANIFATGLPMKKSSFFAIVLENLLDRDLGTWHHWAFEGSLLAGIVRTATDKRLYPVVTTANPQTDETGIRHVGKIINGGVFGTIARSPNLELEKFLRARIRQGHPTVIVFPQRLATWPTNAIDVDNVEIGRTAGRILLSRGRRKWGLVRYQKVEGAHRLRCDGFMQFAHDAGITPSVIQIPMEIDEFGTRQRIAPELTRLKLDGLLAVDSVSSVGSTMGVLAAGLKPGDDLDVLGCDCSLFTSQNVPTITSIDISWREVGVHALNKLVELTDTDKATFDTLLLPPRVLSGTTCPIPSEPPPALPGALSVTSAAPRAGSRLPNDHE